MNSAETIDEKIKLISNKIEQTIEEKIELIIKKIEDLANKCIKLFENIVNDIKDIFVKLINKIKLVVKFIKKYFLQSLKQAIKMTFYLSCVKLFEIIDSTFTLITIGSIYTLVGIEKASKLCVKKLGEVSMFVNVLNEKLFNKCVGLLKNDVDIRKHRNKNPFYLIPYGMIKYGVTEPQLEPLKLIEKILELNLDRVVKLESIVFNSVDDIKKYSEIKEFGHFYNYHYCDNKTNLKLLFPLYNQKFVVFDRNPFFPMNIFPTIKYSELNM